MKPIRIRRVRYLLWPGFWLACAVPRQSAIGEINLLATVIPGQGRAIAGTVPPLCGKNGFSKKFLPALPNYKQVHTDRMTSAQQSPDQSV